MSEWREMTLGVLADSAGGFVKTGPFGSQLHAHEYTDDPTGIPVVMPKDMAGGRVSRSSVSRVEEAVAERLKAHRLAAGDVVLARRGDIGRYAFIEDDEAGWLCGTGAMRVHAPDTRVICPRFLRYAMASPDVVGWLAGQAVGATMPNLNAQIVANVPIRLPAVALQRRVAAVLSAFDDLIEINERRIELLEDLARSLYREWFVRFRLPEVEASEERPPTDWISTDLGSIAGWLSGGTPSTTNADYWDGGIPWITSGSLRTMLLNTSARTLTAAGVSAGSRMVERDTVLFVVRGMSLVRGVRAGIAERPLAFGQDCKALVAVRGVEPLFLAFTVLDRQDTMHAMVELAGHGTGKLSTDRLKALSVKLPPIEAQRRFVEAVEPLRNSMSIATEAVRVLTHTRDALLPRLVTGRLDISEVDLGDLLPAETAA